MKCNLDRVVYFIVRWIQCLRNSVTELDIAKLTPCYIHWFPCWQPCLHIWHFWRSWSNVIFKKMRLLFTVVYVGDASLKFQQRLDTALCFHSWWAVVESMQLYVVSITDNVCLSTQFINLLRIYFESAPPQALPNQMNAPGLNYRNIPVPELGVRIII